jgi:antitoxin VapB
VACHEGFAVVWTDSLRSYIRNDLEVIMLSIRDERIRTLAEDLMEKRNIPSITAAIRLALENEVERTNQGLSLQERVDALRRRALSKAIRPPSQPLTKEERDDLWGN